MLLMIGMSLYYIILYVTEYLSFVSVVFLGTIVTVETVCLTIARHKWDGVINTEECRWIDKWQREKFYFLRVFYITGPPSFENIGE